MSFKRARRQVNHQANGPFANVKVSVLLEFFRLGHANDYELFLASLKAKHIRSKLEWLSNIWLARIHLTFVFTARNPKYVLLFGQCKRHTHMVAPVDETTHYKTADQKRQSIKSQVSVYGTTRVNNGPALVRWHAAATVCLSGIGRRCLASRNRNLVAAQTVNEIRSIFRTVDWNWLLYNGRGLFGLLFAVRRVLALPNSHKLHGTTQSEHDT